MTAIDAQDVSESVTPRFTPTSPRDIAQVFGDVYSRIAGAVLGPLHADLFTAIEAQLAERPGNLLVIGPGPQVLPYSLQPQRFSSMLQESGAVLADYVYDQSKIENTIRLLTRAGTLDYGLAARASEELPPRQTLHLMQYDLRDSLPFADNSFRAVDATLAIHHATRYASDLSRITWDISRVLDDDGRFFFGTADVDMKGTERRVRAVQRVLEDALGSACVRDERDVARSEHIAYVGDASSPYVAVVTDGGVLDVRNIPELGLQALRDAGETVSEHTVTFMPPDRSGAHHAAVHAYYDAIFRLAEEGCAAGDFPEDVLRQFRIGLDYEIRNAERGLVEHYSPLSLITSCLDDAGFVVEQVQYVQDLPFRGISARKGGVRPI